MPLGQKDEMSQNTCNMEHNHLSTNPLGLAFLTTTEERVTMELWKKHRAYIPRRFVVVEVVELVEPSILSIVSTGASPIPD